MRHSTDYGAGYCAGRVDGIEQGSEEMLEKIINFLDDYSHYFKSEADWQSIREEMKFTFS